MRSGINSIVVIGYGNVGSHLLTWLQQSGFERLQVLSHSDGEGIPGVEMIHNIDLMWKNADLYVIAKNDESIEGFLRGVDPHTGLWVHTSASVSTKVFPDHWKRKGVFYPLQTFSKSVPMQYEGIPLFIEADQEDDLALLRNLAHQMSSEVVLSTEQMRLTVHVAAVFACNFNNHLLSIAESILRENNLEFSLMTPLIRQTIEKALNNKPSNSQTGPALRGDSNTLQRHIQALGKHPGLQEIYKLLTSSIIELNQKNDTHV